MARRAGAQQGRARQPGDGDEGVPQEAAGGSSLELQTQMNLREYFPITEKAPTTYGLFHVESTYLLLRHFAKQGINPL